MSDPAYPYASNPVSAQDPYSQQSPYGQAASAPYAQPEAAYGQPVPDYAQPYYASSLLAAYTGLRSQAQIVMVLAGVSFLTLYILLSIPAMVWSFTLCTKAKDLDAPPEIVSLTNTARIVTSICAGIQTLVPLALLVAYFLSTR